MLVLYLVWKTNLGAVFYPYQAVAKGAIWPPVFYIVARLSLVLPATATGQPMGFREAWHASQHNGIRLAMTLAVVPLALYALESLTTPLIPPLGSAIARGIRAFSFFVLGILEVAVLSCAYRAFCAADREKIL